MAVGRVDVWAIGCFGNLHAEISSCSAAQPEARRDQRNIRGREIPLVGLRGRTVAEHHADSVSRIGQQITWGTVTDRHPRPFSGCAGDGRGTGYVSTIETQLDA